MYYVFDDVLSVPNIEKVFTGYFNIYFLECNIENTLYYLVIVAENLNNAIDKFELCLNRSKQNL